MVAPLGDPCCCDAAEDRGWAGADKALENCHFVSICEQSPLLMHGIGQIDYKMPIPLKTCGFMGSKRADLLHRDASPEGRV
jgi:hypothetical protein